MKAWFVKERESWWSLLVHAETRNKAIVTARSIWPDFGMPNYTEMRATRCKALDGKPFTLEAVQPYFYDEDEDDGKLKEFYNECPCALCKGEKK